MRIRNWTLRHPTIAAFFLTMCAAVMVLGHGQDARGRENNMAGVPEIFNSGVGGGAVNELSKILSAASKEIKQMVLHPTGTQTGQTFRRARAIQQIDQIDRLLMGAKRRAGVWAAENALAAVKQGRRTANKQAVEAGIKNKDQVVQGSFELIDVRTAGVFARQIVMDSGKALDSIGARGKRLLRETAQEGLDESKINRILAGGAIEGTPVLTIRKLKAELEKVHGDTVAIIDKNGDTINFDVGYYAEMVARTQTRMATVTARHERLEELDIDLVAIIGKVSNNFCTAFLGQVFSLSGKSSKYPAYDSLPGGGAPFHPLCSKSTRPFVEELATDKQLDHAEILDDSEQLLGMNPSQAQRSFKDLQIHAQIKDRYAKGVAA